MKVTVSQSKTALQYEVHSKHSSFKVGANLHNLDEQKTARPMELLLAALASCSAIDIENILRKQKVDLKNLTITASGNRVDSIPSVFDSIIVSIQIEGDVSDKKIQRAIQLTKDKYCTVYKMLSATVEIEYQYSILK